MPSPHSPDKLRQVCEHHVESQQAAKRLVEKLEIFVRISKDGAMPQSNALTCMAMNRMLLLIHDIIEFILKSKDKNSESHSSAICFSSRSVIRILVGQL